MVTRTLRAFAWMRWRVLMNSLERTGGRDRVERLSLALEQIGPVIAVLLLVPSMLGLAGLGGYAGYSLAAGEPVMTFEALRILLLATCGFAIVGPMLLPSMEPTAVIRLLLLPIPRRTLYAAQAAGALAEPWVIIALPIVVSVPLGLAAGGAWTAAAVSLVSGVVLVLCLLGLSAVSTLLLHLVVRNRRRGELVGLLFVVLIPALSLLPALFMRPHSSQSADAEESRRPGTAMPQWVTEAAGIAYAVVPSELFTRATRSSARHEARDAILPLIMLVTSAGLLHAVGLMTFARLLDSPSAGTRSAAAGTSAPGAMRIPFLSRAGAAVAQAQLRLSVRTTRGRSIVLSPCVLFVLVAVVMHRQGETQIAGMSLVNGLNLATFGGVVSLFSTLPFAMNQFAIDRAGLTMALLSPLETRDLLRGKAVGIGLIAAGTSTVCMLAAFILVPGGPLALWMTLPLALVATYFLVAPGAALLSALFPRTVDLSSIGRGSNPHGLASLLGILLFAAAGLPTIVIVLFTTRVIHSPALTPVVMLAWCGIALVVAWQLFRVVAVVFDKRRENLGIVAS